jgi:chromosome segregation ATPase
LRLPGIGVYLPRFKEADIMRFAAVLFVALACALPAGVALAQVAQESADERACVRLLPEIEKLETMLAQQTKVRTAEVDAQRIQVVTTLLGLRYHSIESLQSNMRTVENQEDDIRGAMARWQAQLDALDEAAKSLSAQELDSPRKAEKAEIEANLKGLEERAKGLRERKGNVQGQLAVERHDIERLEAIVRSWIDSSQ